MSLLEQFPAKTIVTELEPYLSERRKNRIAEVLTARLHSIQLAIEAPADINNALAAVRTCEALGVSKIHFIEPEGDARSARTVTQGAFYWVDMHFYSSFAAFLHANQTLQLSLAGGTVTATLPLCEVPITKPLCLLIGNEQRGLSEEAVSACDYEYTIPMLGMSESLNLSVSAAISLYDTTQRRRQFLQAKSDLTQDEKLQTQAKYYLNSVNERLAQALLRKSQ